MVDETQNTNLQQSGSSVPTGNPQQLPESSLQPQSLSNLQQTSNQTINSINQLDSGGLAIPLSSIAATSTTTTTTTVAPAAKSPNTQHVLVYGGVAIVVAAIMAGMVYNLLKQH